MAPRTTWAGAAAALAAAVLATGCLPAEPGSPLPSAPPPAGGSTPPSEPSPTSSRTPAATTPAPPRPVGPSPRATAGPALLALADLPVKGRAPLTGYHREEFGPAWADVDRNGCDTRNDVLRRDLRPHTVRPGTRGCVVARGTLRDPYTGRTIEFVRGRSTSNAVQVDHVVALADAWQKGAQRLSPERRRALANDPLNLLAVDGPTNQAKGAGDAATWLPPDRSVRCAYVARQVAVKRAYGLWVTSAERDAIARVLQRCPGQRLPVV